MPKQVLIIDDDEDTRIIYSLILQQAGYVVSQAGDGEAGLYAALDSKPALVVLDIGLPKMSGWEVCNRLRSDARTSAAKIVVVTAHAHMEESRKAEECRPDRLLTKPVSPFDVREHVQQLIGPGVASVDC